MIEQAGVKVHDKFSRVLRVETTVNDVSSFKHHRKVEHSPHRPDAPSRVVAATGVARSAAAGGVRSAVRHPGYRRDGRCCGVALTMPAGLGP